MSECSSPINTTVVTYVCVISFAAVSSRNLPWWGKVAWQNKRLRAKETNWRVWCEALILFSDTLFLFFFYLQYNLLIEISQTIEAEARTMEPRQKLLVLISKERYSEEKLGEEMEMLSHLQRKKAWKRGSLQISLSTCFVCLFSWIEEINCCRVPLAGYWIAQLKQPMW